MSQSRAMSAVEAATSTAIGFGIAWVATMLVLPAFGLPVSPGAGFWITVIFTVISLVRGYFVRRLFEAIHRGRA